MYRNYPHYPASHEQISKALLRLMMIPTPFLLSLPMGQEWSPPGQTTYLRNMTNLKSCNTVKIISPDDILQVCVVSKLLVLLSSLAILLSTTGADQLI